MQRRPLNSLLITGGSGFIGSALIRFLLKKTAFQGTLVNLDLLTYAADPRNLKEVTNDPRYHFVQGNINDLSLLTLLCERHQIQAIVHLAAETHVDRSIANASPFIETNIQGTWTLLEAVRREPHIHFHHVSTDEVYGALGSSGYFSELSPYRPNSPYAASKAASDHLVAAYAKTYGLSITISHCSNNYGPGQHPEKLIPRILLACQQQLPIPIYGTGANIRDWLFVEDHVEALWTILQYGQAGETYDIGGGDEFTNLELAHLLRKEAAYKWALTPPPIQFIADRPGHDFRYAIDASKLRHTLGWKPRTHFLEGIRHTLDFYTI